MASILKVDKLDPQSGTALEIGTSGDTITVPSGASLTLTDSTLSLPTTINTDKLDPKSGTALELGSSGDTITIPSGATFTQSGTMNASAITAGTIATARLGSGTASSSTVLYGDQTYKAEPTSTFGTNPFMARNSADVEISFATHTLFPCDSEVYDPDSCYDNSASNYKYTAPATGYYHFFYSMKVAASAGNGQLVIAPKKNGSDSGAIEYGTTVSFKVSDGEDDALVSWTIANSFIMSLSASDYVQLYAYVYAYAQTDSTLPYYSNFWGGWRVA